jgi:glycosyltransferase involved in cell wall biosynthesis
LLAASRLTGEFDVKTTCLINNYNYRRFVGEAVESALAQTVPFDEIIVVDDGSTDGSRDWLMDSYGDCPRVSVVGQQNQGQLGCFHEGFRKSSGDILFFLDADDLYEPDYLRRALRVYDRRPHIDFVYCGFHWFGQHRRKQPPARRSADLGYSVISALAVRAWVGGPTSCLSMRRWVLDRLFPLPCLEDWRTRADDCLVFGASLAGARKYDLAEPLVKYRLHGANAFAARGRDVGSESRRRLALTRLFHHIPCRLGYDTDRLPQLAHREFQTIPVPSARQLSDYLRLVWGSRIQLSRKLAQTGSILGHFVRPAKKSGDEPVAGAGDTADEAERQPLSAIDHSSSGGSSTCGSRTSVSGSTTSMRVPAPGLLSMRAVPPSNLARARTPARP